MADTTSGPADLMSISDLRDALAEAGDVVERSVLSRYVNAHGLVHRREGRKALCSFAKVRDHRRSNYDREIMGGAVLAPAPSAAPADAAQPETGGAEVETSLDERRREKRAKAIRAELDLARELGLVVERAEVEAGMAAAVGAWSRAANTSAGEAADQMLVDLELSPSLRPAARLAMKRFVNTLRDQLAGEFRKMAAELGEGEAAASAPARMDELIALAKRLSPAGAHTQTAGRA